VVAVAAEGAPADLVGTSIVVLGVFDPLNLQPDSLLNSGALNETDLAELKYEIVAAEVAVVRLPWMHITVEANRLSAVSTLKQPIPEPVRDFVFAYCETLQIKRFNAIGLNHDRHFAVSSQEAWHNVGHVLAPKDPVWTKVLGTPGMRSLTIEGKRVEDSDGYVQVKVEPSLRISPGIYIQINDHFAAQPDELKKDPGHLLSILVNKWDESVQRADGILNAIKGLIA
jgi:hypothetical protein